MRSVTHLIVGLTVAVYVVQLVAKYISWGTDGGNLSQQITLLFGFNGAGFLRGYVWQPITYMLLHDPKDILHIVVNLLLLWFLGREVEATIGPKAYTKLYLMAGIAGCFCWWGFNLHSGDPLIGASAAIIGCVIAFATLFPERQMTFLFFFIFPVTMKAKYFALLAILLDVIPLVSRANTNVAHLAHLGGAAFGYLYIKYLGYGVAPRWLVAWQGIRHRTRGHRPPTVHREEPEVLSPEEFIRREIDPILDKISREGMQSLTRQERKVLESAKDLMQKHRR